MVGQSLATIACFTFVVAAHAQLPTHDRGQGVTGAFEGWFRNPDGTFSILVGYFNRNLKEELDIPIGANNRIEPGGPDRGQPTHFLPRRQWGVFTVNVPPDFGTNKLTWTLNANGQTNVIPLHIEPLWEINPFSEVGVGNTPPLVRFGEQGPSVQGPRPIKMDLNTTTATPLQLTVWVTDDAKASNPALMRTPPVVLTWSKYRGPGAVNFANVRPPVDKIDKADAEFAGKSTTTVTFSQAGEYTLLLVANDWSGEGGRGFLCCWTPAHINVTVADKH